MNAHWGQFGAGGPGPHGPALLLLPGFASRLWTSAPAPDPQSAQHTVLVVVAGAISTETERKPQRNKNLTDLIVFQQC